MHLIIYDLWLPKMRQISVSSSVTGVIQGMGSANERRRYNVTASLVGWSHTHTISLHQELKFCLSWIPYNKIHWSVMCYL